MSREHLGGRRIAVSNARVTTPAMPTVRATNTTEVYSLGGDSAGAHSSSFLRARGQASPLSRGCPPRLDVFVGHRESETLMSAIRWCLVLRARRRVVHVVALYSVFESTGNHTPASCGNTGFPTLNKVRRRTDKHCMTGPLYLQSCCCH